MHLHFNFVQQCIQISTRINSSMYIRTSFVCSTLRVSSIRIFILINPIFINLLFGNYRKTMVEHLFNTVFCHFEGLRRIMDQVVELSIVIVKPSPSDPEMRTHTRYLWLNGLFELDFEIAQEVVIGKIGQSCNIIMQCLILDFTSTCPSG